jgi:long-chain fatty acid transport protein
MKNYAKVAGLLSLSAATLFGAGYKIPEQSLNGMALSAAYVANARGADASYYNPANMAFSPSGADMEIDLTYIELSKVKYADSPTNPSVVSSDATSNSEQFFVPTFHYMSSFVNNWRFGLSLVAPGGLSKRWKDAYAKATAQEFTLKVFELNPTASYKINDKFAIGFGLRGVYSDGVVKSDARDSLGATAPSRNLSGDSIDYGYNLALSYRPLSNLTLSTTYRSKVDLTIKGKADLIYLGTGTNLHDIDSSVTIPLPAALNLAVAYTYSKTTFEFVYEKTYWSAYDKLDFDYGVALSTAGGPVSADSVFNAPRDKNWKDTNTYRIGVTHQYNDKLKLMAGFAIDKSPVPSDTLGFELPDSDAKLYSAGFEYKINDKLKVGLAYLYDDKKSRTVDNATGATSTAPSGTFTNTSAQLVTASFKYRF